jgi:hypothetical protein
MPDFNRMYKDDRVHMSESRLDKTGYLNYS